MNYNDEQLIENREVIIIESYDMDIPDDGLVDFDQSHVPIYQFHHYAREEPSTQENVAELPPLERGVFADISFQVQAMNPAIIREAVLRDSPIMFEENEDPIQVENPEEPPSPASSEATIPISRSPSPVLRLECTTFPVKEDVKDDTITEKQCQCDCHETKNHKKRPLSDDEDEDDGKLCPICFDVWTNSGEHRICAIKCGHLFGYSCLERWLCTQKTCPTCKRTVKKTDIRFIYAKKLIALDTSYLNAVQQQLTNEQLDKNKVQMELAQCKQREDLSRQEITNLKKQIVLLQTTSQMNLSANYGTNSQSFTNREIRFHRESSVEISRDGGCRVMDFYKNSNILVVSAQSPNPLFAGYGIKKVTINDSRNSVFIPLHSNTIRDLSFHPQAEILLSASIDKCVRLTETNNNKSVHTVQCSVPIWSCCWDTSNPVYFYVGEQTGDVCKYDMRKTNEKLNILKVPGDFSPVVSLATLGWNQEVNTPKNGVIVCKLNSCSVFVDSQVSNTLSQAPGPSTANHYPLGLSGPFVSMRYCNETKHLLVSSRPNMQYPFAKHTISTLSSTSYGGGAGNLINCNVVHTFQGAHVQKLLSRSCQMKIHTETFVAAHNESQKGVELFSVATGARKILIPTSTPVLDLCHVQTNTGNLLCTLNEKKVDLFKLNFS